jgi:hypothetical protein
MSKIKLLFDKVTLFVSKRNFDFLALSSLKHCIRHNQYDERIANKEYINFYFDRLTACKKVYNFWENSDLPLVTKNLEESSGNLVNYYFGDIVETYNQEARKILQNNKEIIINQDTLEPYKYLIAFILSSDNASDPVFIKFLEDNRKYLKSITNKQLILYFKYFEGECEKNNLDNITLKDRITVFEHIIKL